MAKLNFLHICETAFLTKDSNNLNIIGIFDSVNTQGFPAVHPRFVIVANITPEESGKHVVNVSIASGLKKIFEVNLPYDRPEKRIQIIQNFVNFSFPEEGVYNVQVSIDGQILGSSDLTIKKIYG